MNDHQFKLVKFQGEFMSRCAPMIALCVVALLVLSMRPAVAQVFTGWTVLETQHFRFHFPPQPRATPNEFSEQMEKAHAELQKFFGGPLPAKISFYVWNSSTEGEKVLGRPLGFARADLLLIHATADQTPGHELTHIFVHHAARPEATSRFVEEGTAVALDLTQKDRMAVARAAVARAAPLLPTIRDLWLQAGRAPADLLYPIAGAFIDRLLSQGRDPFLRFLKNQTLEHARLVYGARFDELIREFEAELLGDAAPKAQALADLRTKAQTRMQRDREVFGAEVFREIEELYQPANQNLRAPGTSERLRELIAKYPTANRSGCALIYLARISEKEEREALLKRAIAEHEDAWFGDGAQVGPFARALLAQHYLETARQADAVALAEQVNPQAVDHLGNRLVDNLRRLKLLR
jgi:hypothetical protein